MSGQFGDDARYALWRLFDVGLALAILASVLPLLVLVVAALLLVDRGPVFFVHRRIGYRGRHFGCLKFRTMRVGADAILAAHLAAHPAARQEWEASHKLLRDPRVTPVGAVMRRLSIDEFPQLLNVLAGDMSLVGPRPIVDAEIARYGRYFAHYCQVRPGLTGLWQTSGRSETSYRRRVAMDVAYIGRKSVAFDCWLLLRTVPAVMFARGAC